MMRQATDAAGHWLLTETEAAREKLLQAAEKLLATGMLLDQDVEILGV